MIKDIKFIDLAWLVIQKPPSLTVFDKLELFNAFPRRDLLISIWALSNNPIVLNVKKFIIKVKEELYFKIDPNRFS